MSSRWSKAVDTALTSHPRLEKVLNSSTDCYESSKYHLSLSVQVRWDEDEDRLVSQSPFRVVPIAFSEPTLGYSGQRFKSVYCASSHMTTSDKNVKDEIRELDEAEKNVAKKLKASMRMYKLKKSF